MAAHKTQATVAHFPAGWFIKPAVDAQQPMRGPFKTRAEALANIVATDSAAHWTNHTEGPVNAR